jgi:elongation factor P
VATTADFKNGLVLQIDGQLWQIVEFQHVKPGKGPAFVRTKLKNVLSGKVVDRTYNAGVKVETATVDRRDTTYLYRDGSDFVFMDSEDYEQHMLPESLVGDAARFLLESMPVQVAFHDGNPLFIELPVTVELEVTGQAPAPSQRPWRPAQPSTCRCSLTPATSSRSTPATAATWVG